MLVANISEFRKDIKSYFERISKNFETLIIHRSKEEGIVMMSLDTYNALVATQHELSSRANEKRLDSAIEKLKNGQGVTRDLIED